MCVQKNDTTQHSKNVEQSKYTNQQIIHTAWCENILINKTDKLKLGLCHFICTIKYTTGTVVWNTLLLYAYQL